MPRPLRMLVAAGTVFAVGCWLFADTVRHHYPPAADPNTIRFAHFGTYQDYQTWGEVIAAFERTHPGLEVRREYVVGMYGAYNTKLRQQMLSGTLPHAFLVQLGPFANLAEGFADLTDQVADPRDGLDLAAFAPTSVRAFTHQGRIRGLPVSGGNLLIYCNPDCFARAAAHHGHDVPLPDDSWTMQQFPTFAPLALGLRMYQSLAGTWTNLLMAASIIALAPVAIVFLLSSRHLAATTPPPHLV